METGHFSPVMQLMAMACHGHHGPPCLGMKDLGVEASHVTLGILVKAGGEKPIAQVYPLVNCHITMENHHF